MGKRKATRKQGGSNVKKSAGSRPTRNTRNSQDAAVLEEVLRLSSRSVQPTIETQGAAHQQQVQNQTAVESVPGAQPAVSMASPAVVVPTAAPVQGQEVPSSQPAALMSTEAPAQKQCLPAGQPAVLMPQPPVAAPTSAVRSQDAPPGEFYQSTLLSTQGVPNITANANQTTPNTTPLASVCAPLGEGVSQSLRQKIGRGEFIDLGLLLENWGAHSSSWDESRQVKITFDREGHTVLKPDRPKIQITTIAAWTSAFLVYASIFVDFHPHRAQEMFKYIQIIRSAAVRFGSSGWRLYDRHFRMRQERKPMNPWSVLDSELWFLFVVTNRVQNRQSTLVQYQNRRHSSPLDTYQGAQAATNESFDIKYPSSSLGSAGNARGVCFEFNSVKGCTRKICKFPHKCSKCGKPGHPSTACWAGKKGGQRGGFQRK